MKILSIIVAAYNVEKYIEKALKSCDLNDDNDDYEVIVVNDGSNDSTEKIVQDYVKYKPTVFKLINKENGGYGSAINAGIMHANGKYVKLMDGDDWYDTKELSIFLDKLRICDADMVITDFCSVNDNNMEKSNCLAFDVEPYTLINPNKLMYTNEVLLMHRVCMRTDILAKNDIKLTEQCFYTDTEYIIYPLPFIQNVEYMPLMLYQYRIGNTEQSMSLNGIRNHIEDMKLLYNNINQFIENLSINANNELIEWRIAMFYKFYVSQLLILGDQCSKDTLRWLIKDIRYKYFNRYKYMRNKKIDMLLYTDCAAYKICSWLKKVESKNS